MFAPNSIKTLMGIKSYNQLDQSKENINKQQLSQEAIDKKAGSESEEDKEFTPKHYKDMSEKVIDTRFLIKEMDSKIEELKKWKRSQKRDLEKKLAENKKSVASNEDIRLSNSEELDSSDQYIQKLEEMMNLYKSDLDENRKTALYQDYNYNSTIKEIGYQLSEREQRIAELSQQLAIHENQRGLITNNEINLDFAGDIQILKNKLEGRRKEFNESVHNARKNHAVLNDTDSKHKIEDNGSLKKFIEKEKKEASKVQKYDFKDDLDDIDNELKELEDLLNST